MKKFVLSLDLHDAREKRKALKTVSALPGIDEITIDFKGKTMTVIGVVDPITVATKLRKYWPTDILSVGPAKEPEKKEEPKKDEAKKEEPKKEEGKKEEPKKEEDGGKKDEAKKAEPEQVTGTMMMPLPTMMMPPSYRPYYPPPMPYRPYYPPPIQTYYAGHHQSIEENPNACVIS